MKQKQKILKRKPRGGDKTLKIKSFLLVELLQRALDGDDKGVRNMLDTEYPKAFRPSRHKKGEPAAEVNTDREILRPLQLERPRELVDTRDYVFETVFGLFERLHDKEPEHPIFGEAEKGIMR